MGTVIVLCRRCAAPVESPSAPTRRVRFCLSCRPGPPSRKGAVLTAEQRAKISQALRGRPAHPNFIAATIRRNRENVGNRFVLDAPVKGECVYCGGPAQTHDHVVPLSRGGADAERNIVLACFWCNRSKSNRTPEEWIAEIPKSQCRAFLGLDA